MPVTDTATFVTDATARSAGDAETLPLPGQEEPWGDRIVRLKRLINCAPTYTSALSWWTGFPLHREPRVPDTRRTVSDVEAKLLDIAPDTLVIVRDGYLVPAVGPRQPAFAAVTAVVVESALHRDRDLKTQVDLGTVPMGTVLRGQAQRASVFTVRVAAPPEPDAPALISQGRLMMAGVPIALATEATYWRAVTQREPATMPHYLHPTPRQ